MVIGIQSLVWPDALQARLDIKGPDTLSLIASTSVDSAGTRRMGCLMSHSMTVITTSPLTIISVSFSPAAKGLVKIKSKNGTRPPWKSVLLSQQIPRVNKDVVPPFHQIPRPARPHRAPDAAGLFSILSTPKSTRSLQPTPPQLPRCLQPRQHMLHARSRRPDGPDAVLELRRFCRPAWISGPE